MNIIEINGVKAVVSFDKDIELFRGEFVGINGGADFYADNVKDLYKEGEISLNEFLEMCKEDNVKPFVSYSGKFNLRIDEQLHKEIVTQAKANNQSLNAWVTKVVKNAIHNV